MANSEIIPMPSVRLAPGLYEVLGTSRGCEVMRTPLGWELVVDGTTFAIFATKREALQYAQTDVSL